jgi:hypothetical protein
MHEPRPRPDQVENNNSRDGAAESGAALAAIAAFSAASAALSAISSASEGSARSVSSHSGLDVIRPARDGDVLPHFVGDACSREPHQLSEWRIRSA